jgi:VWFA-related protein
VHIEPAGVNPAFRGVCGSLGPADIQVFEDGEPVEVTDVDRTLLGTVHAILIDTSLSMRRRLRYAQDAAIQYLESLPPDELVMIASFDDNLVVRSPPTTDRRRLTQVVRDLEIGFNTSLWDSLYHLMRYLAPFPQQKVVVLLTDGEDSSSIRRHALNQVLRVASTIPNLTIFPIGVDLPPGPRFGEPPVAFSLAEVARGTGGSFYEVKDGSRLDRSFRGIRKRLEGKHFIAYIPKPFGEGPLDGEDGAGYRSRRVKVKVRNGLPCKIVSLESSRRLEGAVKTVRDSLKQTGGPAPEDLLSSGAVSCLGLPDRWTVRGEVRHATPLVWGEDVGDPIRLYPLDPPVAVLGKVSDVVLERGTLYEAKHLDRKGRWRLAHDREPSLVSRNIAIAVPPLETVHGRLTSPEDVVLYLLGHGECESGGEEEPPGGPLWVHGQTMLDLRHAVAWTLFHHVPAYRDWARERVRKDLEVEMAGLLRDWGPDRLRRAAEIRSENPEPDRLQHFLAEWLGDVSARDLALRIEARAANRLLDPSSSAGMRLPEVELVLDGWGTLRRWLPPPTRIRILAPLVPAYDPERRAIGFYRVLLPKADRAGAPRNLLPQAPLGLHALRWLLADPAIGAAMIGRVKVASIDHGPVRKADRRLFEKWQRRRTGERKWRLPPVRSVELKLSGPGPEEGEITVTAYVPEDANRLDPDDREGGPVCLRVLHGETVAGETAEAAGALRAALESIDRSCPSFD